MAKKKSDTGNKLFDSSVGGSREISFFGDRPNPNLRGFVEKHSTPYDPDGDSYGVRAFDQPITTSKATAIYNMHSYHQGKKPHDAIRQYIKHYTSIGDLVLDPFSGSGGTALAALMEGRSAVAIDRSPAATFITKCYCSPLDPSRLRKAFANLARTLQKEVEGLYATRCERCDGAAITTKTVYSQVFKCPRCLQKVALFDCVEAEGRTAADKPKKVKVCPECFKKGHKEIIRSQSEKYGFIPVMVHYSCLNGCSPANGTRRQADTDQKKRKYFIDYDLAKLKEIEATDIPYSFPTGYGMTGFSRYQRDALYYYGVKEVSDLFTRRNLRAIAAIHSALNQVEDKECADALRFGINGITLGLSRLNRYMTGASFPFYLITGTYYVPQVSCEEPVWKHFANKIERLAKGYHAIRDEAQSGSLAISTQSSIRVDLIPSNSVDYVFTDPPYSDTVQYGELNYVWEAWMGLDAKWHEEEVIVNDVRGKTESEWAEKVKLAMAECYRVLKPGRWLSLCYHDTSEGTWELVQDIMAEVGFVVDKSESALFIDTGQKSFNQLTADKTTKRDLVLNFRKPKPLPFKVAKTYGPADADKLHGGGDVATFTEFARQIVKDFLIQHPGATKDRIYDELVSRLVASRSMEAHDFDALLRSVAEEVKQPVKEDLFRNKEADLFGSHVQSRWYLKETADQVDHAEQAKEDAAAARLAKFVSEYLKKKPELEGVHYSDLFEQFLPVHDKPRRLLADWLPEYFVKTPGGTWRLPDKDESQQLAKLREAGTLRRIKRFANALIDGVPVRDKDRPGSDVNLLDWLRQCRRAGLYEQGKAIYEKGGLNLANLTDEQQIEAEDDYRICSRRGSTEEAKPKRQRRKKQDDDE
jgi:DNA modification methylase